MIQRALRRCAALTAVGLLAATLPANAAKSPTPLEVAFTDCVESIGVGLAPTPNVAAITAPGFVPVGAGTPLSPVVVRTADCAGIAVDSHKPKPGSIVQVGAVIVPPQLGVGDINNYTFWYYTTDEKLAHRLQEFGVSAQHAETLHYDLDPQVVDTPNDLTITVRRPGDPRFTLHGTVLPSEMPSGSFEAIWWHKTSLGNVRMDTNVPVIAISSADLVLTTDAGNALARLIGTTMLTFPIIQQFNMFSTAHMSVRAVP
jgi:hypothetical protein